MMSERSQRRIVRVGVGLCVGAVAWLIGSDASVTPVLNTLAVGVLVVVPAAVAVLLTQGEA